ncbi:hypothetical protein GH733_017664 [Mirounga leonina]|nr:hypothetical protein GH733_017664 [Mirounga leonina]
MEFHNFSEQSFHGNNGHAPAGCSPKYDDYANYNYCDGKGTAEAAAMLQNEDASSDGDEDAIVEANQKSPKESSGVMALQILVPFLLAGFGTVSAGMVLDIVQHWEVFKKRLWQQLYWAGFQRGSTILTIPYFCALAVWQRLSLHLFCKARIIMVGVIVGSKKTGINPDNVATPIAASFGDLITLAILAWISQGLYSCLDNYYYISPLVGVFFLALTPIWIIIAAKHPATRTVLHSGWEPVITAMIISSIGGLILDTTVSDPNLVGIVVYTPVINGIGGNLVAIQASRISTYLHLHSIPGELPDEPKGCYYPFRTFFGPGVNNKSAQVLLLLVIPGHLIFLYTIHLMKSGHTSLTVIFIVVYVLAAVLQGHFLLELRITVVFGAWPSLAGGLSILVKEQAERARA